MKPQLLVRLSQQKIIPDQPIEGLYVAGTDSGSLYYSPYYDIPGFCYGLCIDSGYICAEEAAAFVKA